MPDLVLGNEVGHLSNMKIEQRLGNSDLALIYFENKQRQSEV